MAAGRLLEIKSVSFDGHVRIGTRFRVGGQYSIDRQRTVGGCFASSCSSPYPMQSHVQPNPKPSRILHRELETDMTPIT